VSASTSKVTLALRLSLCGLTAFLMPVRQCLCVREFECFLLRSAHFLSWSFGVVVAHLQALVSSLDTFSIVVSPREDWEIQGACS
jgi:hypothetical protein